MEHNCEKKTMEPSTRGDERAATSSLTEEAKEADNQKVGARAWVGGVLGQKKIQRKRRPDRQGTPGPGAISSMVALRGIGKNRASRVVTRKEAQDQQQQAPCDSTTMVALRGIAKNRPSCSAAVEDRPETPSMVTLRGLGKNYQAAMATDDAQDQPDEESHSVEGLDVSDGAVGLITQPPPPIIMDDFTVDVEAEITEHSEAMHQDLAVANLVRDSDRNLPVAEEFHEKQRETITAQGKREILQKVAIFGLGVLVGAVLAVGLMMAISDSDPPQASRPMETEAPSQITLESSVRAFLPSLSLEEAAEDLDSPQSKALDWILGDPFLADYPDWRVLQRYLLATFYHATGAACHVW